MDWWKVGGKWGLEWERSLKSFNVEVGRCEKNLESEEEVGIEDRSR